PAFIISFILFTILSPQETLPGDAIALYKAALLETGLIHPLSWIPIIVLIGCTIFKISAFVSLTISSIVATLLASITSNLSLSGLWTVWFEGYEATTSFESVNELLTKGGINSMLFTISLVILALGFGGLLFVTGIIPSILSTLQDKLKKARSIVLATAATAIGINV